MISHRFTLIELIVVIAIVAILAGIMLPVISKAVQTSRMKKFVEAYQDAIPADTLKNLAFEKLPGEGHELAYEEFDKVADGKMKLDEAASLQPYRQGSTAGETQGDLYERWAKYTGNPKGWTRQEFEALAAQNEIPELMYHKWAELTGNPKAFTREQFEALKAKNLVSFPAKEEKKATW
jgi:prepilin-type N-terminal cleavage/methylation domain-containing protein